MIPVGLCQCGCGGETKIATKTRSEYGWIKGHPRRYLYRHYGLSHSGEKSTHWTGGKVKRVHGYTVIYCPSHPRAHGAGYVYEHILVMESMLGRSLVAPERVHHLDGDKANNIPENLHLCKDDREHFMIHQRSSAKAACGHEDWRKCRYCKQWGPRGEIKYNQKKFAHTITGYHQVCKSESVRARKANTMKTIAASIAVFILSLSVTANSQTICFNYGSGVVSCNTPTGITTITELAPGQGIIYQYGGGEHALEPYTIVPYQTSPSRRLDHYIPPLPSTLHDEPAPRRRALDEPSVLPMLPMLPGLDLPGMELP